MASRIEIARGSLSAFLNSGQQLIQGELFWQAKNNSNNAETGFKDNPSRPWDEGTLYIGNPSLKEDGSGRPINETPLPIAGTRSFKSFVYKGTLSAQQGINITEDTIGDTFKITNSYFSIASSINVNKNIVIKDLLFSVPAIANNTYIISFSHIFP